MVGPYPSTTIDAGSCRRGARLVGQRTWGRHGHTLFLMAGQVGGGHVGQRGPAYGGSLPIDHNRCRFLSQRGKAGWAGPALRVAGCPSRPAPVRGPITCRFDIPAGRSPPGRSTPSEAASAHEETGRPAGPGSPKVCVQVSAMSKSRPCLGRSGWFRPPPGHAASSIDRGSLEPSHNRLWFYPRPLWPGRGSSRHPHSPVHASRPRRAGFVVWPATCTGAAAANEKPTGCRNARPSPAGAFPEVCVHDWRMIGGERRAPNG
jgi:hypothetical protein